MQETASQYIARINSYLGNDDVLTVLSQTPQALQELLKNVPEQVLRQRPTPDKWSVLEQVVHLSDVEIVVGFRVRFVLGAEDGAPIVAFDQDRWQQAFRYNERDLAPTLESFRAARENNLRLYRSLTAAQWEKYGMHSERGKETVRAIVNLQGGHDRNHLKQMQEILAQGKAAVSR